MITKVDILDLSERNANRIIPLCCYLPVSCRSLVDRCDSLGSCKIAVENSEDASLMTLWIAVENRKKGTTHGFMDRCCRNQWMNCDCGERQARIITCHKQPSDQSRMFAHVCYSHHVCNFFLGFVLSFLFIQPIASLPKLYLLIVRSMFSERFPFHISMQETRFVAY